MKKIEISDEEFERRFDAGEDISEFVDWKSARRPGREAQRVNVDFPSWMVSAMDNEASRLGVSRQALIKFVMNSHLQENSQGTLKQA
ncbi:MAG: BrnA family antitoxin [Candidatus Desulfovibrio kirbyi]|jgi:predicted DNA binding CopG/RHH family protein|uniref:BrnA family antitoxin n=1 Tax=Candidatus Desulfovibrio kirbyi TaxID=2696086 RepID=A0A6L2R795_9BACT|nr:MAG: BrnA family antitoxin [Candidatus Desulfovibrio kirbyi]